MDGELYVEPLRKKCKKIFSSSDNWDSFSIALGEVANIIIYLTPAYLSTTYTLFPFFYFSTHCL
jgi:hypothetical protein